jgi:transcriptional regulator with XRE-family HTH domain
VTVSASKLSPGEGLEDVDDGRQVRWTSRGRLLLNGWLAKTGVTTEELARRTGLRGSTIRALTTGAHAKPDLEGAIALEDVCKVAVRAWLEERGTIVTRVTGRRAKLCPMPTEQDKPNPMTRPAPTPEPSQTAEQIRKEIGGGGGPGNGGPGAPDAALERSLRDSTSLFDAAKQRGDRAGAAKEGTPQRERRPEGDRVDPPLDAGRGSTRGGRR